MLKKFVYSIPIWVLALTSMFAFAAGVGDKIGEVVYTDIAGYINHYPISTYAYDGGSVVVAEDLVNYGFSVSYDENTRRLGINPDRSISTISGMDGVYRNATLINRRFADALSTDITVSLGNKIIPAYAINGYMTVKLEDLADESLGIEFNWDESTRSAKLWIDWAGIQNYVDVPENPVYTTVIDTCYMAGFAQTAYFRSSPSDDSGNIIGEIPYGAQVGYIAQSGYDPAYTRINYNGTVGYVRSEFLSTTQPTNFVSRVMYISGVEDGVYLRSTPYEADNVITTIPLAGAVGYIDVTNEYFTRVEYNGLYGYVKTQYLSDTKPAPKDAVIDTCYMAGFAQTAYFRSSPSDDSVNIIGEIPYGALVGYIEQYAYDSAYTKINYNGTVGYVRSEFLSTTQPTNFVSRVMYISGVENSVYLRSTPYEADNVITTIPVNNAVGYIDTVNFEFTRVEYHGLYGYVKTQYLSNSAYSPDYQTRPNSGGSAVYRTPYGKRYHFDPDCGGPNSYQITMQQALDAGLTPCQKCAR